jgi:hypothetical protein
MQFSDEFLSKWECLIGDVDKTEIPLECLKKVILKLEGRRQRTINLHSLRKQGLDVDELELFLTRTLGDLGEQVVDLEFVVDAAAVAAIAQPATDKILSKL